MGFAGVGSAEVDDEAEITGADAGAGTVKADGAALTAVALSVSSPLRRHAACPKRSTRAEAKMARFV